MAETLGERLKAIADSVRAQAAPFADAVDVFVARLEAAQAGSSGPQVGERMPSFTLPDQDGRLTSLEELLADGPLIVAIHRGHWCPYCQLNMTALAEIQDRVSPARIVTISPETRKYTNELRDGVGARFPFLTDVGAGYILSINLAIFVDATMSALIESFGKNVPEYQGGTPWIIPIPSVFLIDADGTIVARHIDPDYRRRMEPADILSKLELFRGGRL